MMNKLERNREMMNKLEQNREMMNELERNREMIKNEKEGQADRRKIHIQREEENRKTK